MFANTFINKMKCYIASTLKKVGDNVALITSPKNENANQLLVIKCQCITIKIWITISTITALFEIEARNEAQICPNTKISSFAIHENKEEEQQQ